VLTGAIARGALSDSFWSCYSTQAMGPATNHTPTMTADDTPTAAHNAIRRTIERRFTSSHPRTRAGFPWTMACLAPRHAFRQGVHGPFVSWPSRTTCDKMSPLTVVGGHLNE
jgi:hypothetical protein